MDLQRYETLNQTNAHARTSDRYEMIPTSRMLDILADHGWMPSKVQEARTRVQHTKGFQKHVIRLRNENQLPVQVGEYVPELVLINSHMGSAAFQLMAGIFRLVCSNGLVVGDSFACERVRHTGFANEKAENALRAIVNQLPSVITEVDKFRAIALDENERQAYAQSAIELLADSDNKYSIQPKALLSPRRWNDAKDLTLWGTFNTVQENIIKGGIRRYDANNRRTHTRQVKNIDRNVQLNKALWTLAEKMAELKN